MFMERQNSGLHIAIIMDGNGRWAEARGFGRAEGHRAGRGAVNRAVFASLRRDVRVLTLFTFSTDNWERPQGEVDELMRTFENFFEEDAPALAAYGVSVAAIGRRDRLPASLRDAIEAVEKGGIQNEYGCRSYAVWPRVEERLQVRFAIDYSGREAILEAARRFEAAGGRSPESFARFFGETPHGDVPVPDVDLLIRTGGEQRLSNCLLWEIAYAELYFTPCLWPDFGPADLDAALQDFYTRDRRFGRIPATV